jgi:hypothetical protein
VYPHHTVWLCFALRPPQVCPEYIQRDIVTLLPELVDDSLHEVHTRAPIAIPDLRIGPYVGASRAACRLRLTLVWLCRGSWSRLCRRVAVLTGGGVGSEGDHGDHPWAAAAHSRRGVRLLPAPTDPRRGAPARHGYVRCQCLRDPCQLSSLHCCRKAPSHAIPPVRAGMLQAIPEASIACVTRFLFQTCRVDQVGTVYEAVATCLHSVDMSGKCKC